MTTEPSTFTVELPAGGNMQLLSTEEVEYFEQQSDKYQKEYNLTKLNDLALVGALLTHQIIMYRASQRISGMEPEFDSQDRPTGKYVRIKKDRARDLSTAQGQISKASEQIMEIEKALGIDKKTRESGGQHTLANYLETVKKAAHQYGVRIKERITEYEGVMMEARWKLRVLANGDPEDMAYHDLSEEKFCAWLREKLEEIEQKDREWAKEKGAIFNGKL